MPGGRTGDIFGSFRRDTGGAAETCEVLACPAKLSGSEGNAGSTRGTLLHT